MKIDLEVLKELRSVTGAGIGDCKEALVTCSGDIDKAKEFLREKGIAKAYKKSQRNVADGLVSVYVGNNKAAIVKLGCETDFVARNERFCAMASSLAKSLCDHGTEDMESFLSSTCGFGTGSSVSDEVISLAAVLGENVVVGGVGLVKLAGGGVIGNYVHSSSGEGIGKAAALVVLEAMGGGNPDELAGLAKQIAMHVVAAKPEALSIESLSSSTVEYEKGLVTKEVQALGKPESVAQKIIDGRMQKFFEDMVLLEQTFVMDGQTKIRDLLEQRGKSMGCEVRIADYRFLSIA